VNTTFGSLRNIPRNVMLAPLDAAPVPTAKETKARSVFVPSSIGALDVMLAAALLTLMGFGVVMVFSASSVQGSVSHHDPLFFLKRQASYAAGSLAIMFLIARVDYHRLYKLTYPVLFGVGALLVACIAGLGRRGGGAARWIAVGPVNIQPAEMAKLALVCWLAYSLAKKADQVKSFAVGFLPHLLMAGVFVVLCMKQPDFGSAVVLLLLTFTMMFVAGAKVGYILGAMIVGSGLAAFAITSKAYRYARYLAWMNMNEHRQDLAYQPFQSVMSFGSGGFSGTGLGRGLQTLYLPEAHNDFIAAIIGEELGFLGVLFLTSLYLLIVARGIRIALRARDDYGSFLAFGISAMFGVQALLNIAVALALLPTKGLTLPFVSFGGSSLIVNATAAGVLLAVSRQTQDEVRLDTAVTPSAPPVAPVAPGALHSPKDSGGPIDVEAELA
jgi:cell division protein FtsW